MSEDVTRSEWRKLYFENVMKYFVLKDKMHQNGYTEEEVYNNTDIKKGLDNIAEQLCLIMISDLSVRSLFRYSAFSKSKEDNITWSREQKNLENDTLYLSSLDWMNDPFEFKQFSDYEEITTEILKQTPLQLISRQDYDKQFKPIFDAQVKKLNEAKSNVSIKCFCEEYDNLLLWSHYSNAHTGYCVEYNSTQMFNIHQEFLVPVIYQLEYPSTKFFTNEFEGILNVLYRLATKSKHWEYENEWRVVRVCNSDTEHIARMPKPKAIYLGCNVEQQYEGAMLDLCKKRNITLYKMRTSESSYTLDKKIIFKGEQ